MIITNLFRLDPFSCFLKFRLNSLAMSTPRSIEDYESFFNIRKSFFKIAN